MADKEKAAFIQDSAGSDDLLEWVVGHYADSNAQVIQVKAKGSYRFVQKQLAFWMRVRDSERFWGVVNACEQNVGKLVKERIDAILQTREAMLSAGVNEKACAVALAAQYGEANVKTALMTIQTVAPPTVA